METLIFTDDEAKTFDFIEPTKRHLILDAASLVLKDGFHDGNIIQHWWEDNRKEAYPYNEQQTCDALKFLVEHYLLPVVKDAGFHVRIKTEPCNHNPIRVTWIDGYEVPEDNTTALLGGFIKIAVSPEQVIQSLS